MIKATCFFPCKSGCTNAPECYRILKLLCCTLHGPGGERIVDVVPGRTELETQVKTGSCAGCTHSQ